MKQNVIEYKGAYIVSSEEGVDVVDMETGKWKAARTVQSAKWNLSVWRRLSKEFTPKPHPAVG